MFQRMKSSRSYLETSIFFVILLASLTLFLGIFIQDDWVSPSAKYCIDLDDDWTIVKPDGKEIEVDGEFSIGKDKPVTFYRILPENIQNDDILRIKCPYETVDAYCGGEHIYHAGEAKLLSIHTTVGNVFALIPLKKDYSGKKITITVKPRHYGYEVLIKDAAITTMSAYSGLTIYSFKFCTFDYFDCKFCNCISFQGKFFAIGEKSYQRIFVSWNVWCLCIVVDTCGFPYHRNADRKDGFFRTD